MLAYAASAPRTAERRSSPHAMLAIIAGHVAVIAVVMSARMDLPQRIFHPPTVVDLIPEPTPPAPNPPPRHDPRPAPGPTVTDPFVPLPPPPGPGASPTPVPSDPGPAPGPTFTPLPEPVPLPPPPVHLGPELITPPSQLRPPYPASKLAAEEEALLKLRLTIDERGRVVAVDPVGRADAVFLTAARRYLIAHWRYRPASDDGRAVASSLVITLKFQLDG